MDKLKSNKIAQKIGSFWSTKAVATDKTGAPLKLSWWQSPFIVRHINKVVGGEPVNGMSQGLLSRIESEFGTDLPFKRAISVGGGAGQKEMALLRKGLVSHFDLYELSTARVKQGEKIAEEQGLKDRITFHLADAFEENIDAGSYDLVHWNNSLHHMFDVDASVAWSRTILREGGLFYMDDFIGQDRFQWSDQMLEIASMVRSALDEKYLVNPGNPERQVAKKMLRPSAEKLIEADPSEAVQSFQIISAVKKYFPDVKIIETGGVIYSLALSQIIHNFDETEDKMILELLMIIDVLSSRLGENHYAVAWSVK